LAAWGVSEEKVCDGFGDGEAGAAFEHAPFAAGVDFEEDVLARGGAN
jgi:hypothetical protein